MNKTALFLVLLLGLLVTCHCRAGNRPLPGRDQDVPPNHVQMIGLYRDASEMQAFDPGSLARKGDAITVIVVTAYSDLARRQGIVARNISATSGRMLIDCARKTYAVLSDHKLDMSGYIVGEVGDLTGPHPLAEAPVAKEIAQVLCRTIPPGTSVL